MISIVTASYNSARFLGKTIESVLSQTYEDWELIIVDDFSSDDTVGIVEAYAELDRRIRLINLYENSGAANARNVAIEASRGKYIAFLDSDDIWLPHKLEKQISFMEENGYSFTYSFYQKISSSGDVLSVVKPPMRVSYEDLLKTNSIGCLTAIYDVEDIGKVMMSSSTRREDYTTWLEILKKVKYAYAFTEILAQYRVHTEQSSSKKIEMAIENWKVYRDVEKLNIFYSLYYFSNYAVRGILDTTVNCLKGLHRG